MADTKPKWAAYTFGAIRAFESIEGAQSYIRGLNKKVWAPRMFRRSIKAGSAKLYVVVVVVRSKIHLKP